MTNPKQPEAPAPGEWTTLGELKPGELFEVDDAVCLRVAKGNREAAGYCAATGQLFSDVPSVRVRRLLVVRDDAETVERVALEMFAMGYDGTPMPFADINKSTAESYRSDARRILAALRAHAAGKGER